MHGFRGAVEARAGLVCPIRGDAFQTPVDRSVVMLGQMIAVEAGGLETVQNPTVTVMSHLARRRLDAFERCGERDARLRLAHPRAGGAFAGAVCRRKADPPSDVCCFLASDAAKIRPKRPASALTQERLSQRPEQPI
jgi:hypothetical protein